MNTRGLSKPIRLGFSLIEVLIAVLVLGIGLLGLAAVFPVVITQQREASDVILGGVASQAIRNQILLSPDIAGELISQDGYADADEPDLDGDRVPNEPPGSDQPDDGDGDGVPDDFDDTYVRGTNEPIFGVGDDYDSMPERYNQRTGYSYLWEADWEWGDSTLGADAATPEEYLQEYIVDGGVRFRDPMEREDLAGLSLSEPDLPVGARLYPRPFSDPGAAQDGPRYVWDFVPRRSPNGTIQLAVFVRRLDPGIRVPSDRTLSAMLTTDPADDDAIHPVGMDDDGLPTRDGTGRYAVPLSVKAEPVPADEYPDSPEWTGTPQIAKLLDGVRLNTEDDSDTELGTATHDQAVFVAEIGQRFVDNLGVVREVIEVLDVAGDYIDVRVRPAFELGDLSPTFEVLSTTNSEQIREGARAGKLRQAVFTMQAPIDVFVMEFNAR